MNFRRLWLPTVLLLTLACGGGNGGPSAPIQDANIGGTWTYAATNLVSGGFSCNAALTMSLTQASATFHGSYSGSLTCFGGGEQITQPVQGQVVSGTVDGNSVTFNLDTSDFRNTGSVSGGSMSGNATMRFVLEGDQFVLTGPWSAARA